MLATDVVGFTRLVAEDEDGTLARLRSLRKEFGEPLIAAHGGRTVKLAGDGTIVARVASEQNVSTWVKAGVMIRETLSAGSAHAFMLVSPAKGTAFQRRTATGGASVSTSGPMATAPRWVKLTRTGQTIAAYDSVDGVTWTLVGTDTIPMGPAVFVGVAVTSHNVAATATATFDNVNIR